VRSLPCRDARTDPVTVTRHTGTLRELAPAWAKLVEPDQPGAPFRRCEWIHAWWRALGAGREAMVLVARAGGEIIGILPLYAERLLLGGRRLRLMGDGIVGSDYLGVISRAADSARLADAFAAHLATRRTDDLRLDDLRVGDELIRALAARNPALSVTARYSCPFVAIEGSFATYLAGLRDGAGTQWRRRRRWLERNAGLRIEELAAPEDVARGLQIFLELHRERWATHGSDAIDGHRIEDLHRDAARHLAALGWARVFVLHAGGAPRAALYGWVHGRRFTFYQAGRDPSWANRSVGTVLLGAVLERCFELRLKEFDFLRGTEEYKTAWATGRRETLRLGLRGRGMRNLLAHVGAGLGATLRSASKQWLAPRVVAWLRRQRRRLVARSGGSR
jgi:CelD/BcsL family acetyltransferase involved in cellulose biosynthesis